VRLGFCTGFSNAVLGLCRRGSKLDWQKAVEEDLVQWGERVLDPTVSLEQLLAS
jgi:hypothetical protein